MKNKDNMKKFILELILNKISICILSCGCFGAVFDDILRWSG